MKQGKQWRIVNAAAGLLLALLLCFTTLAVYAEDGQSLYQPPFEPQAQAVYITNMDSDMVVYQKNAETPMAAASLVKMMTSILLVEHVEANGLNWDEPTIAAEQWVFDELFGKNASHADVRQGEVLTSRELLYAMLLPSANEAALVIADFVSGGYYKNFVYLMNQKAQALGCTGTSYADPNGLSEENVTTARDMALITKEFMSHPLLVEVAGTATYEMAAHNHAAPYNILTTNRLLVSSDSYARKFPKVNGTVKAGKTGSLGEWQNFASMAVKNEESYICVVLQSPNAADVVREEIGGSHYRPALYETAQLYDWVFATFAVQPSLDVNRPITEVKIKYSTKQDSVRLIPAEALKAVLPKEGQELLTMQFTLPDYLETPVKQGDKAGTVTVLVEGKEIGTVELLVSQDVERNFTLYIWENVKGFFGGTIFKVLLLLILVAGVAFAVYTVQVNRRKQEAKRREMSQKNQFRKGGKNG